MSEAEDQLKRMVLTFRVSELQALLGFAGKNKTGRKSELQSRALSLAKNCSSSVKKKIKQLFDSIQVEVMSYGPRSNQGTGATNPHSLHANKVPQMPLASMAYAQQTGVSSQQQRNYSAAVANAALLQYNPAVALTSQQQQQLSASYPINPDVKLKKLPFYDILAELLKPSSLAPQGSGRYQEAGFCFSLTPQQANKIANSRDLRPGKTDYNVQVQMRFCLLETSCEQEDNFPPNIAVKINDKMCPLPSPIPTNKPGVEPKRPSRPVNITAMCRISPTVTNRVQVSWASEYGRCYVISAYLVQKLSSDDLLHRLKSKGVRIADFTRSLIKQKLNEDADCEIATTSLRCSLMCPLGKMRMLLPCRANTCNHLQCFDASLYLQMNERKPTWTCPVCDKPAVYDTLVIDGYFQDVLRLNTTSNEVTLHKDGSWTPLVPKKDRPEPQAEKRKSVVAIETLSDSDDDDDDSQQSSSAPSKAQQYDDSVVEEVPSGGGGEGGGAQKKKASDVEIITLESSSEEDDDDDEEDEGPPAKRQCTSQSNGQNGVSHSSAEASAPTPVISASVASSLAQLPAATTVLPTTVAPTTTTTSGDDPASSQSGSENAKSDDSWRVGTVDPGKRLIFRKSMSCGSNGASATTTATANGEGGVTTSPSSEPIAVSPPCGQQGINREDTSSPAAAPSVNNSSSTATTDDHHQSSISAEKSRKQILPTRTSSRTTRFQGITWEGDTETSSSSDDDDEDGDGTPRSRGGSRRGGGYRSRASSAGGNSSGGGGAGSGGDVSTDGGQ